ncbi:NmrA/HSCARG family protein [Streptosporangium roseum]|uniref:NmrA family protein n=1 Tax=Streptosporangium roseum (strain ATCC 12428 / DSM 43021 / JCM 3005 / KCTC 9067 / NCIMB 10171 / NRRL 2505 / NI 9100) TaxID=479432 RepID=D2BDL1_STRRD|nr:NmrA/HSCARG family protein [Streptosporangium roseum]ACZ86300.1 NmrA family protein [Streptosporangium roseum DSM 43021]
MAGTILVLGGTGNQGGAAAAHLLAAGWHVRALVRDPSGAAARALADAGAELVAGDMGDRASLDAAARDVHGVFSVQPTWDDPVNSPMEVPLGIAVADAAEAAGVRHLVYTSVAGVERASGISHWETKWQIERHIRALGLPATFLRPVQFMENYASPRYGLRNGTLAAYGPPDRPGQLIAVDDIGVFAALAFADPGRYLGEAIELAGDAPTPSQVAAAISRATGHPVSYRPVTPETIDLLGAEMGAAAENLRAAYRFVNEKGGWQADIPALRRLHPGLTTFDAWLDGKGAALLKDLFATRG